MKKIFLLLVAFSLFVSCEENFNPFGELKDKYALTCIIRGDTTFQVAALTRIYSNENYNPYSNEVDPNIKGALIRIWNGDSVATFKDTTLVRQPDSKYKTPYHLYYTKNFSYDPNYGLEIEAILPNGVRLTSKTNPPQELKFVYVEKVVPPKNKTNIEFIWYPGSTDNAYLTQVSINYYKADDPQQIVHVAYVPVKYIYQDGKAYPISPKPNNSNKFDLDVETISKTMELISDGDSNKKNYVILGPYFQVVSFDKNLSTYFNSITHANDAYTVNLNEVDYTNINNGLGVFGAYMRNYWSFDFTHAYIKSFGYTPGLADVEPPL